jgi:mRNA interferase HicA
MTSAEFKRWLAKRGCTFEPGKGSHQAVYLGNRRATIPMHGKNKELGKGLVEKIKRDLGLK